MYLPLIPYAIWCSKMLMTGASYSMIFLMFQDMKQTFYQGLL